ncbi:hypothetical protein NBRC116493_19320 [Aurantivibrio infirmus]
MRFLPIGPYPRNVSSDKVRELIANYWQHGISRHQLLQVLVDLQHNFGWISPSAIEILSDSVDLSAGEITGIIDFYHFLRIKQPSAWQIYLSTNITDMMLDQNNNLRTLIEFAESHPEKLSVNTTSCTGLCEQGPALLINGFAISKLNPARIQQILNLIQQETQFDRWPEQLFSIPETILASGPLLGHTVNPGELREKITKQGNHYFLEQLKLSGLQGRGGAAFNTFFKWQSCIAVPADKKYVVCNADEGEPGTFKDRVLLNSKIDNVLEGMSICAEVIGATHGFIYLRNEYLFLVNHIQNAIDSRRKSGLFGENFDIEIHLGAGAYICGEESALLESLEGKRGIPRIRPPFPVSHGYLQQPTVVNNVETFCNIALIADFGADKFREAGTKASPGTKLHSISGDCPSPGIVELPLGATIKEALLLVDAKNAVYVQVGGPSGKLIHKDQFHLPLDFENIHTGGSLMVFNESRSISDILSNYMQFFSEESCGFCTPCRVGTAVIDSKMKKITSQQAGKNDIDLIIQTSDLLSAASHCGLGKAAGDCARQIINDFHVPMNNSISDDFVGEEIARQIDRVTQ